MRIFSTVCYVRVTLITESAALPSEVTACQSVNKISHMTKLELQKKEGSEELMNNTVKLEVNILFL